MPFLPQIAIPRFVRASPFVRAFASFSSIIHKRRNARKRCAFATRNSGSSSQPFLKNTKAPSRTQIRMLVRTDPWKVLFYRLTIERNDLVYAGFSGVLNRPAQRENGLKPLLLGVRKLGGHRFLPRFAVDLRLQAVRDCDPGTKAP